MTKRDFFRRYIFCCIWSFGRNEDFCFGKCYSIKQRLYMCMCWFFQNEMVSWNSFYIRE